MKPSSLLAKLGLYEPMLTKQRGLCYGFKADRKSLDVFCALCVFATIFVLLFASHFNRAITGKYCSLVSKHCTWRKNMDAETNTWVLDSLLQEKNICMKFTWSRKSSFQLMFENYEGGRFAAFLVLLPSKHKHRTKVALTVHQQLYFANIAKTKVSWDHNKCFQILPFPSCCPPDRWSIASALGWTNNQHFFCSFHSNGCGPQCFGSHWAVALLF